MCFSVLPGGHFQKVSDFLYTFLLKLVMAVKGNKRPNFFAMTRCVIHQLETKPNQTNPNPKQQRKRRYNGYDSPHPG